LAITYTPTTNFGAKDSLPGATIATSDVTVGAGKTLDVSAGTLTLANDQISGDKIEGGTIGSVTITTADINGGTLDGVTIGGSSAGAITGTTITGTSFVSSGDMTFGDNDKAIFGAGSDLQIYHDGSASYVQDTGTGALYLQGDGGVNIRNAAGTENKAIFASDGAVTLYHNNAVKFATTATGIDVTGTVTADGLTVDGDNDVSFRGNSNDIVWGSPSLDYAAIRRYNGLAQDVGLTFHSTTNAGVDGAPTRMKIDHNGDISFYEDTGSTQYREQNIVSYAAADYSIATSGAYNLTFKTNSTEAMRIDSSGNLLVGTTDTTLFNNTSGGGVMLSNSGSGFAKETSGAGDPVVYFNNTGDDGQILDFRKDGTTVGSIGVSSSNNIAIGSTSSSHAGIVFGTNTVAPMDVSNFTSADNAYDLGNINARWDDIYATNSTIQTSDANEKQDIEELSEAERRVAVAAKGLLRKFRWKSAVEKKGDDARIHFGIIAQDLQAAFEAEGLDAGRYAMFIHSTWTDEETGEERSRMGVRYSELLAFIIAAL